MALYQVWIRTETRNGDFRGSVSSPTLYLDSRVQGVTSVDHAEHIVEQWLTAAGLKVLDVTALAPGDYHLSED